MIPIPADSGDGWIKFADGTVIEYGTGVIPVNIYNVNVLFPHTIRLLSFVAIPYSTLNLSEFDARILNPTTGELGRAPATADTAYAYIGIGRWK